MKKTVLHLVYDEKFIDGLIKQLDTYSDSDVQNLFATVVDSHKTEYRYITQKERIIKIHEEDFFDYLRINSISVLVLHSFTVLPIQVIANIPAGIKVFWVSWGFDVYNARSNRVKELINIKNKYHSETLKAIKLSKFSLFWNRIKPIFFYYSKQSILLRKAVQRVDYHSGILEIEYELMKKNSFFKAKKFQWVYADTSRNLSEKLAFDKQKLGKNILIGNSADSTNNHIDAFKVISKFITDQKIIVPLSYSGNEDYKQCVINEGYAYFGNKIDFLMDFIPYQEYMKILDSCNICIFAHERQQAMGNIYNAILRGCVVYLSSTSLAYKELTKKGYRVYSIQDNLQKEGFLSELSDADFENNKKVFATRKSVESIVNEFYSLVKYNS